MRAPPTFDRFASFFLKIIPTVFYVLQFYKIAASARASFIDFMLFLKLIPYKIVRSCNNLSTPPISGREWRVRAYGVVESADGQSRVNGDGIGPDLRQNSLQTYLHLRITYTYELLFVS